MSNQSRETLDNKQLSSFQFSLVQKATYTLPAPLKHALENSDKYSVVNDAKLLLQGDAADTILLNQDVVSTSGLEKGVLLREILKQYFSNEEDSLNIFCSDRAACKDKNVKKKQLQQYFRGSFSKRLPTGNDTKKKLLLADIYAIHATEYFTDPSYRCKHPLTSKFLESIWGFEVEPDSCTNLAPFLVSEAGKKSEIRWVDPSRVYAIHLLFAGKAGSSMSRFGHLGLRIIQCNQTRAVVNQRCEEDLFDHIALGFKANIDELDLSLWKGITGGYAVKLYAQSFIDIYREYTIDEFRNVYSLPIILNEQEKNFLLKALSEVHWSYQNDYKFFTQNCATEVYWLLNQALNANKSKADQLLPEQRYRPDRLFDDAKKSYNFNAAVFDNLHDAEAKGYYFPSAEKYYQQAVDTFTAQITTSEEYVAHSLQEWASKPADFRLQHWLKPVLNDGFKEDKKQVRHAAAVLEGWVANKIRREIFSSMLYYYGNIFQLLQDDSILLTESEKTVLANCINVIKISNDTAGKNAEGIPQSKLSINPVTSCEADNAQFSSLMKRLFELFPFTDGQRKNIEELKKTDENIKWLNLDSPG